jgi:hypothetical protein
MVTSSAPLFVSSGDLIADRRYRWAIDHARRGNLAGAADILVQTVELAPAFATPWFALGAIWDVLSDRAADHVRDACRRAGLNLLALDPTAKRTEKGVAISGLVIVARSGG